MYKAEYMGNPFGHKIRTCLFFLVLALPWMHYLNMLGEAAADVETGLTGADWLKGWALDNAPNDGDDELKETRADIMMLLC